MKKKFLLTNKNRKKQYLHLQESTRGKYFTQWANKKLYNNYAFALVSGSTNGHWSDKDYKWSSCRNDLKKAELFNNFF